MPELDLGRVVGPGVAPGGAAGSLLSKLSVDDYDTGWKSMSQLGTELIQPDNPVGASLSRIGEILITPESHRMIFRGNNLGTALTTEQKTNIQNGTFKGLWLGDYWVINGVNWRIVDMDYWWNCGDTAFTKHHLVIMPDANLVANKQMNTTNTTEGGYVGSLMYTSNMNDAKTLCTGAFGANILTHRDIFCNAVTNGRPTGYAWLDASIELPTEVMMYGCPHYAVTNDGTNIPMKYAISKSQLALFAVAPKFITTRQNYWLQDVVSSAYFACVDTGGYASSAHASTANIGVRPVFPVGVS